MIKLLLVISALTLTIAAKAQTPNFAEHVAPIIWKNCVKCHRTGEIAPFTLTSYGDVSARASSIKREVSERLMPPWKPEQGYGSHADPKRLTQEEIDVIAKWVDEGAVEGDQSKTPPLPTFPEGSQLGTPDLVLKMSESWRVKGDGKDVYRNFVLPTGLLENKVVSAIEFRPGNASIVHHALIFLDTTKACRALDAADPLPGYSGFGGPGFEPIKNLLGWVPGITPRFFPPQLGITMFKASDIVVQIHYAPSDFEADDQSSINFFFAKKPAEREIQQAQIINTSMFVNANEVKTYKGQIGPNQITVDISIMAVAPHMHMLGTSAKAYAVTPTKDTIKFINIPSWDFHWQGYYMLKNLVKLPKGSTLYYEATYDNTTNNIENPNDPPKRVTWGESTFDEMFLCYFLWAPYRAGDENITLETSIPSEILWSGDVLQTLAISPNPTSGMVSIIIPEGATSIEMYSSDGRRVFGESVDALKVELKIETDQFAVGSYRVVARSPAGFQVGSLVIE